VIENREKICVGPIVILRCYVADIMLLSSSEPLSPTGCRIC